VTCRGLQISVPLAPTVSLLLSDSGVYKVGKRWVAPSSIATPADMLRLNQLTFLAAQDNLYFANWEHQEHIGREVCSVGRDAAAQPRVTEAFEEGNELSSLLHLYEEQPLIDLALSFVSWPSALADLAVEAVALGERDLEPVEQLWHGRLVSGRKGRWGRARQGASPPLSPERSEAVLTYAWLLPHVRCNGRSPSVPPRCTIVRSSRWRCCCSFAGLSVERPDWPAIAYIPLPPHCCS
jgi:hypothetical protein